MTATILAPEIRDGLPADDYHADRTSVSSSGLRKLLAPGCPAQFKYDLDHPPAPKKEFDLGHAAHLLVLGEGPELEVIDFPDWKKAAARELKELAYDEGKVPLLTKDYEMVQAMAAALRQHPIAGGLLTPGSGIAERSIYFTDPATGIRCRVRPDFLKPLGPMNLCVDYKTCADANPLAVSRAIRDRAYHQQDALYIDGIDAAMPADEGTRFVFVFQSKAAPHLITVRELTQQDRDIGRARNDRALRIYADCMSTGEWPDWTGPVTEIPTISMPSWDVIQQTEEFLS